ncbi:MAG: DUF2182 domain-containing protein [Candidatus Omnitrophica bacterium]|nr:DUF2182 domain-containing protein [Candidatus Omnitrophota bacterium]
MDNVAQRRLILISLGVLVAVAWVVMVYQARQMTLNKSVCCLAVVHPWQVAEGWSALTMWVVMMAGMMVPSAVPMVLMFAALNRRRGDGYNTVVSTWFFVGGYLIVWAGFSVLATALQWYLQQQALLSAFMASAHPWFGGFLLILAGVFQWTPLKQTCLRFCQTPFGFLMTGWRQGNGGALVMGLHHGMYCVGCCWALMGLLFVLGVMNLWWILALSFFVLAEKVIPPQMAFSRMAGWALVIWGLVLVF